MTDRVGRLAQVLLAKESPHQVTSSFQLNFRRVSTFSGKVEAWAEWSFVFKASSRGSCLEVCQIIEWLERQEMGVSTEQISQTFMSVNNVEKLGVELFDLLCTL